MERALTYITLDVQKIDSGQLIKAKRGDSARRLVVSLTNRGRPYIPGEGVTAVFYERKPDGNPCFNEAQIDGCTVTYDFTGQTTNVVGLAACEIRLYDAVGQLLTSPRFEMLVDATEYQEGDVPDSSPEYTALTEMVSKGTELIRDLTDVQAGLEPIRDAAIEAAEAAERSAAVSEASANLAKLAAQRSDVDAQAALRAAEEAGNSAADATAQAGAAADSAFQAEGSAQAANQAYVEAERMTTRAETARTAAQTAAEEARTAAEEAKNAAGTGGGGGLSVTDDGDGNISILPGGNSSISDDGNGNLTLIKELQSLTTPKGVYNSFPDKTAREQLGGKLNAPGGVKAGDYLRVQSVGADGTVVLEGAEPPGEDSGQNATNVFAGKTAIFFGDSLTEQNYHYTKGYHAWIKELLGLASYKNYGVSGYKVSSVYDKVNSVADTADLVFIMCGVNDQTYSVPLGAMGDDTAGTTYGALNLLCGKLKEKFPTSIIVFITPTYQEKYPHNSGVTSYEISRAIREVCEKYAIPVYDNFVLSGIYGTNLSVFTTDKTHWNNTAHEMVGRNIAQYMTDTFRYVYGATSGGGSGGGETPDEPEQPAKTLSSISATYSGGSVPVGTAVSALTGVVVTARYSDGSTAAVTGYTLSGSIAEGENTVTVTYGGMTATFTVTGVAESDSTKIYAKDYGEEEGLWTQYGNIRTDLEGYTHTDYIPIGANVPFEIYTNLQAYMAFFDAEKKFISITLDGPPSQFTSVNGTTPANCAYFAFNMKSVNRDQYYIEY